MNRSPLSQEPASVYVLLKRAYTDSFSLGIASTFAGAATSQIRSESIILGFIGFVFLFFFITDYVNENEISILRKNIKWFNTYSLATYISVAIAGFFIHFEASALIAIIALLPTLFNACLVRPLITINVYKKSYTRLFGVIDV